MIIFHASKVRTKIALILESCEQYREQLIQYCQKYFGCEYEYAEDCVQDAYVALVENLGRGIVIRNYKAWLYAVVLNYKNKAVKDIIKRNEFEFKSNKEKDDVIMNSATYEPDYLDEIISDESIEEQAVRIISALDSNEKELYISYYIKCKKLKEIADEMGIAYPAVRKRHTALKKKIHKLIKEYENKR